MALAGELRKTQMMGSKTQYYGTDGTGRDTYIYNINGGFSPEKTATTIDPVSKYIIFLHHLEQFFLTVLASFVVTKGRPVDRLANIHSKPVSYTNNGSGRDTYISASSGGLKNIYQPAYQKRTFYNNLREYTRIEHPANRTKSNTATAEERSDLFSRS